MSFEDFETKTSEYHSSFHIINRINFFYLKLSEAKTNIDLHNWFSMLVNIEMDLITKEMVKKGKLKEFERMRKELAKEINLLGKNPNISDVLYEKLIEFEIGLRLHQDELELGLKKQADQLMKYA